MVDTLKIRKRESHKLLSLLSTVELFSTLLDDDLTYVASKTALQSYQAQTDIFLPGVKATQLFIVQSGSVSIISKNGTLSRSPDSRPVEIARYLPGDVFGDFQFAISARYDVTARALENTILLAFPCDGQTIENLSLEKPDVASRILLRSITMIASRLRSTDKLISENTPWVRELRKQIFTDPPTGLWNKAYMDSEIPSLLSGNAAVLMIKPDKFKEINDTLGHAMGDEIIGRIAALIVAQTKKTGRGWAIRLRSNEMALIVPKCSRLNAITISDAIQKAFPGFVQTAGGETIPYILTASICVGLWPQKNINWREFTDNISQGLQEIWKSGGNRTGFLEEAGSGKN